jgi:hypothetical protein
MARMQPCDDPILKRFRAALDEIYGDRLERVVLYGSRARGTDETGVVIDAMPYRAGAYDDRRSLMHEIRREGVEL